MAINNKQRWAQKKAKKIRQAKLRKVRKKKPSTLGPVYAEVPNPFAHLSDEQRKEVIKEIAKKSEQALKESLARLKEILTTYEPLALLSTLASYGLVSPIGDEGFTKKDSDFHINQSHIELLQATTLQINPAGLKYQVYKPEVISELWAILPEIMDAQRFRGLGKINPDSPNDEKAVNYLQEFVRGNTQTVRNWGYFSQVTTISGELYSEFDDILLNEYGFTATATIKFFKFLISTIEQRSTERFNTLRTIYQIKNKRAMVRKYYDLIGQSETAAEEFITSIDVDHIGTKILFSMLMSHYDLRLHENYLFTNAEIADHLEFEPEQVISLIDNFSLAFGELSAYPTDHIFLNNPVWTKPIIKIDDDRFFCTIPQLFFSFVMPALENPIEKLEKELLNTKRSDYLERKIAEIIKRRFPEANTVSGLKWTLNGTQYETDLITFIDSHALIVEAKSGKITDSALRGAPDRLKRHVKDILIDPNIQSKRLQDRLYELIKNPSMVDELRTKLPVPLSDIHKVIRVSVSLEDFAMLQANVAQLKETGWLPEDFTPCPSMNLADFETLFDFLEHPVQVIHYLQRRQELESTMGYVADELDLMGAYIGTLFNFGDIDKDINIAFIGMSAALDNYYNSKDAGVDIPKPKPKISILFTSIFNQIEIRKIPRWTEIGALLSRFSPDDQRKLESLIYKLKKNVEKNWNVEGHKNMLIYSPPKVSEYALAFVIFNNQNAVRRYDFIENAASHALEPEHVKQALIVGINMDDTTKAYHSIAMYE